MPTRRKGFTLVEIMVAITLIAILSTVGFTTYSQSQVTARDGRRKQDLKAIQTALELYFQQNRQYPPAGSTGGWCTQISTANTTWKTQVNDALLPYISNMPNDPSYANTNKDYFYSQNTATTYALYAVLENTKDPAVVTNILTADGKISCAGGNTSYNYKVTNP